MSTIDKLRKAKAKQSWMWLVGAACWFLTLVINLFADKPGLAALNAACFSVFMLCYYESSQDRLNRDLLHEIDTLRDQLPQRRGDSDSQSGPWD